MSASRIAKRYATPLLELAEEKKSLEKVKTDIQNFLDLCNSNRDLVLTLKSPIISHLKKAEILEKVFGSKVDKLTMSFFDILTRKNRESLLPEVATEFIRLYNAKMGYQEAQVTTAIKLSAADKKAFEKLVADITGKKPLISEKVDPELVGGYVVKMGDRQIDDSIHGKLKELKLKFQKENN